MQNSLVYYVQRLIIAIIQNFECECWPKNSTIATIFKMLLKIFLNSF